MRGVKGDRLFALRDVNGKFGSGKNTRRFRNIDGLLNLRARYLGDWPEITFPDGRTVRGDDSQVHGMLSDAVGLSVTLAREADVSHFDAGAVHIVTTASLAWLQSRLPDSRIRERRFRPNIVGATSEREQTEQSWIGRTLRIGTRVALMVKSSTERCRMTTFDQLDLPADPDVLRCIAQEAALQFGVYAEVVTPGRIARGDSVVLE